MNLANKPAFPLTGLPHERGLTIRQHFAGLALQGLLSNAQIYNEAKLVCQATEDSEEDVLTAMAVNAADALIAQLEKP